MLKIVIMEKLLQNLRAKNVASTSRRYNKSSLCLFRITPHKITQGAIMRNFHKPIKSRNLINRLNKRRQPPMNRKHSIINKSSNRNIIEQISKVLPNNRISIFCLTFHIKAVILSDGSCLMITWLEWIYYLGLGSFCLGISFLVGRVKLSLIRYVRLYLRSHLN